jgi:hypothetical protein
MHGIFRLLPHLPVSSSQIHFLAMHSDRTASRLTCARLNDEWSWQFNKRASIFDVCVCHKENWQHLLPVVETAEPGLHWLQHCVAQNSNSMTKATNVMYRQQQQQPNEDNDRSCCWMRGQAKHHGSITADQHWPADLLWDTESRGHCHLN